MREDCQRFVVADNEELRARTVASQILGGKVHICTKQLGGIPPLATSTFQMKKKLKRTKKRLMTIVCFHRYGGIKPEGT